MLGPWSSVKSASAPIPTSTWSRPSARTAASSSASSAISDARKTSNAVATSTGSSAPPPAWHSGRSSSPPSTRPASPASAACASARRCCSSACGATPSAARFSMSCSPIATSRFPSNAPSSSPFCTGSWSQAPIAPASSGATTTASTASVNCSCITSTGPWPGSARNYRRRSRLIARWCLVASKISSRSDCLRAGATSSLTCRWCSWTPPRCISRARAALNSASVATPRTIGRT